jgi:hypothetical protein
MLQSNAEEFSTVTFLITEELSDDDDDVGDDSGGAGAGMDAGAVEMERR